MNVERGARNTQREGRNGWLVGEWEESGIQGTGGPLQSSSDIESIRGEGANERERGEGANERD